ncbi:unnamed protein product, partial [Prorocentrum cordatum]
ARHVAGDRRAMSVVSATVASDPMELEKPYFPKKRGPKSKAAKRAKQAADRMFTRHMKELKKLAKCDTENEVTPEAKEFMKKYTSTHSST